VAQVFGPRANLIAKLIIGGTLLAAVGLVAMGWLGPNVHYFTRVAFIRPQPVPFSHEHHVSGLGIDCRYCHTSVEVSATAGYPATHICMSCHSQIWTNADMLAPVRRSLAEGKPIRWNRVNALPDYVFFDHSIHVAKGVGCTTCHGPINEMPLVWKGADLQMGWCLDCHRNPGPNLRPHEAVFDPDWHRGPNTPSADQLVAANHIHPQSLSDCSVCHR
jgi:hypothetical protein